MSRQDPGAATGQPAREPGYCVCGHVEPLHRLTGSRTCTGSRWCGCTGWREVPAPPSTPVDLDGVRQRIGALATALHDGSPPRVVRLLAGACADDIPGLLAALDGEA